MKFTFTLLILGAVAVYARPSSIETFQQFKKLFNKQYESIEQEEIAQQNFLDSLEFVRTHENAAINSFSDLSAEEFKAKLMMSDETFAQITANTVNDDGVRNCEVTQKTVPASLDLRTLGYVTSIKQQGPCGSCWAFSCIASVESAYLVSKNQSLNLSEQNLMDCASNHGCHGEAPPKGFKYLQETGVIDARLYPYFAVEEKCHEHYSNFKNAKHYLIKDFCQIYPVNEGNLKQILAQNHTAISVIIGIKDLTTFRHYNGKSIIREDEGGQVVYHAVNVIGYGNENGVDYWIIKNSWGQSWGDHGFFRMEMNKDLMGIADWPYVVTV